MGRSQVDLNGSLSITGADAGNDLVTKCVDVASQACVLLLDLLLVFEDVVDDMLQLLNVGRHGSLDLCWFKVFRWFDHLVAVM